MEDEEEEEVEYGKDKEVEYKAQSTRYLTTSTKNKLFQRTLPLSTHWPTAWTSGFQPTQNYHLHSWFSAPATSS